MYKLLTINAFLFLLISNIYYDKSFLCKLMLLCVCNLARFQSKSK